MIALDAHVHHDFASEADQEVPLAPVCVASARRPHRNIAHHEHPKGHEGQLVELERREATAGVIECGGPGSDERCR